MSTVVRRSAGAIFWGLTLVTLGALLLAHNLGYPITIWRHIVRYWPALLIAWGLLKFVDFYRFRRVGDNRPLFSGGEVALLILVIFAGSAITTAANVSPEIGHIFEIGDIDLWDITGDSYTYEQRVEQQDVRAGSDIEIVNWYGNIEVRPADTDRIVVEVVKTLRASDRSEADRMDRDFVFSIKDSGSRYTVMSNRDEFGSAGSFRQRYKSSLMVQVPKRSALKLQNRNGRIFLQDLTGSQSVVNRYGDIEIRNITGAVQIENRNGTVTVMDVTEGLTITNRYANTTVKNIGGELRIETRNGSVDIEDVKGNASIENAYAPINARNVEGNVTISGRNNSVELEHIQGDIRSDSSYQNVNITDARGAVTVTSRNGDLRLTLDRPPQKDIEITSRYGTVVLELPSSSAFSVEARTEYGNVYSDFDGIRVIDSRREKSLSGETGQGGPRIAVTLRNGDIRLEKRG